MQASIDISMYPLSNDYSAAITDFILKIRSRKDIKVETNGLSTQLFGDYDTLIDILKMEMAEVLKSRKAVFVIKLAPGERTREKLSEVLK